MNIKIYLKRIFFYSILIASVQIISCKKTPVQVTPPSVPIQVIPPSPASPASPATPARTPIANAGPIQVITLPVNSVALEGSVSIDPNNTITNLLWTKTAGPSSFNIINSNALQTQVTNLVQGNYLFELKVTDNKGATGYDTTQIIVNPSGPLPTGLTSVYFWILNAADDYYGKTFVSFNNQTRELNCYWSGGGPEPCSGNCSLGFDLPAGNYSWNAYTSKGTTASGIITITNQTCIQQKIVFK